MSFSDPKPKQVMIHSPGQTKPKPTTTKKKPSHPSGLDVEKKILKAKEDFTKDGKKDALDLTNSDLTSLPVSIQSLSFLTKLYLYKNRLVSLPNEIGFLENLEFLALNENSLTSLPDSLANLRRLILLDLRHNKLNDVSFYIFFVFFFLYFCPGIFFPDF